ncbi:MULTISPECIES: superoxide dismutase family protein [unclassified Streptomyces]|uniref:superoxide dismutase family protein n=1 Tax=unclassified Streptomyces TaxID=2593676 RepID=UPI001367D30F|nr:superoxide dismutase family protein [Streptomyces sp. SceaMP-e96]MYT18346.1 superoxide dismutase family protein [Streptomyces sp. SID4951]
MFHQVHVAGQFAPPTASTPWNAVTYDMNSVPAGSGITVSKYADNTLTVLALAVSGLRAGHTYGAHVHTKPCGNRPADAGPHYQDRKDPHQPSVDPTYANAKNEVWLDFTTNAKGDGAAVSLNHFKFRPGEARSVVIHEHKTETGPHTAGIAGARMACFTLPLSPAN